ncbi:MAG: ferritin-like domain-containing protein [Beijerinckiaceae bacterium]
MAEKTLKDLLIHSIKDMYFAENRIYKTLPKLIEAAENEDLKQGLADHREETGMQIARLEQMFQLVGEKPGAQECKAIKGILEEGDEGLEEFGETEVADAALIANCQAVEHYEITRYGTMLAWAEELGLDDVCDLIQESLAEEHAADEKLTAIAEGGVNMEGEGGQSGRSMSVRSGGKPASGKASSRASSGRASSRGKSPSGRASGKPKAASKSGRSSSKGGRAASSRSSASKSANSGGRASAGKRPAAKSSRGSSRKTSGGRPSGRK